MRVVIWDRFWQGFAGQLREALQTEWTVSCPPGTSPAEEVAGADAVIALTMPAEALAAARGLRLFQFPGAGAQHFQPGQLPAGCILCNVYEHEGPIAEYVLAAMLLRVIRLPRYWQSFRCGRWEGSGRVGGETHEELRGKTVGLIGYGRIGQAVAARARAFGMDVIAIQQAAAPALPEGAPEPAFLGGPPALEHILSAADFLVVACPLTNETRGMIGAPQLAKCKPDAMLINVARAEIVEEEALFEALRDKRIGAAALDVWYQYPESPDQVMHGSRLPFHELPDVIVTPHLSAGTHAMATRRLRRMAENLDRLAAGKDLENVVLAGAG